MKKIFILSLILLITFSSCRNDSWEFADFDYTTVYFAYQYPVRTITLGDDIFDTSLDNDHKCKIMATLAGVYKNRTNRYIDVTVDESLCDSRYMFKGNGQEIKPMPAHYYTLESNRITIPKGEFIGGIEVQLSDAFFADPLALQTNYVIPLRMTDVQNADSILEGRPNYEGAHIYEAGAWAAVPKNYVLYAIKYKNPWHGAYLRRGKDVIKGKNGNTDLDRTVIRHKQYVEKDEVCEIYTESYQVVRFPLDIKDAEGKDIDCELLLTFDDSGKCTVSSDDFPVTGAGEFVTKGEKNSFGGKDRDAIYLEYQIDFDNVHYTTTDTLVVRDRGSKMETFEPVLK